MYGLQALLHLSLKYIFRNMKKILGILLSAVLVASCFHDTGFETDYVVISTFTYQDAGYIGDKTKPDSLLYDTHYKQGFTWDYLGFYHKIEESSLDFRGGFLGSCLKVPATSDPSGLKYNQYRSNALNKNSFENKYAVFCQSYDMPAKHLSFMATPDADTEAICTMKYMFVTNTVAVEQAVKQSFVDGDKLILKATGYLGDQQTGSAEINLAEFTAEKDSIITSWTLFNLGALGSVDNVRFEIHTNSRAAIPTTVCIDDVAAHVRIAAK